MKTALALCVLPMASAFLAPAPVLRRVSENRWVGKEFSPLMCGLDGVDATRTAKELYTRVCV
jgi:hypothetical protein